MPKQTYSFICYSLFLDGKSVQEISESTGYKPARIETYLRYEVKRRSTKVTDVAKLLMQDFNVNAGCVFIEDIEKTFTKFGVDVTKYL
jgi:hypothetical protein